VLSAQNSNARQNYLDRLTKWPGKGKAVEHAQQNVKMATVAGTAANSKISRLGSIIPSLFDDFAGKSAEFARKTLKFGRLGFAATARRRHMLDQRSRPLRTLASKGPFFDGQRFETQFWPL
jgi:hypothetical protein